MDFERLNENLSVLLEYMTFTGLLLNQGNQGKSGNSKTDQGKLMEIKENQGKKFWCKNFFHLSLLFHYLAAS